MHYIYRTFTIDATADFSAGWFFARARITTSAGELCDACDPAQFDCEADALDFAQFCAIGWIDEHLGPDGFGNRGLPAGRRTLSESANSAPFRHQISGSGGATQTDD